MAKPTLPTVHQHQTVYSPETLVLAELGYLVLDNFTNQWSDWLEYRSVADLYLSAIP